MSMADGCVSVAVLETRDALTIVAWIAHKQRTTSSTLRTHCVIHAIKADVQLIRFWSGALRVTVTFALNTTVRSNVAKMASAHIRL